MFSASSTWAVIEVPVLRSKIVSNGVCGFNSVDDAKLRFLKGRITMDKLETFHNLVNMAAIDNKFTDEEVQFLAQRANDWKISNDEFETALAGISEGQLEVTIPESYEDRVVLLKEMIRIMAIDGELADMEKRLCAQASGKMDFTTQQFRQILDEVIAEA